MPCTRATCPVCRKSIAVKDDGTLRQHRSDLARGYRCQGSGGPPLGPWPRKFHSILPEVK